MRSFSSLSLLLLAGLSGWPLVAQVPQFQTNNTAFSVDINGVMGSATAFALVSGSALCNGGITPFNTLTTVASGVPNGGFELALNGGPVPVSSALGGAILPDGQVVNLDTFFPTVFLNGGLLPAFAAFSSPLLINAPIGGPLSVTLQGVLLNPAALLGFTLSQPTAVDIDLSSGVTTLPGPTSDDGSVSVDLTAPATCWAQAGMPFYGTAYTTIFVMSNGRVRFDNGFGDFTPTVAEAQVNIFVGLWTDLSPNIAGSITVTHPAPDLIVTNYSGIPYFATPGSASSFSIELNTVTGEVAIAGLNSVEPLLGTASLTLLGITPGGNATDPGPAGFALGGLGGPFGPTDMIGEQTPDNTVPTYVAAGGNIIQFLPVGSSYSFVSN